MSKREFLLELFDTAVAAAQAENRMSRFLPPFPQAGRLVIVGAGKASAAMAKAAEAFYQPYLDSNRITGLVIAPDGVTGTTDVVEVANASHPFPDHRSVDYSQKILNMVEGLAEQDIVLVLLSGGASALLCAPKGDVTLDEKRAITKALFNRGASIHELNTIRRFMSAVKGGQLARASSPASVYTMSISDVVGDDPQIIGSGPTVQATYTLADVERIVEKYAIDYPASFTTLIALEKEQRSQQKKNPTLPLSAYQLIARPMDSLKAAAQVASQAGYECTILGDSFVGEATQIANSMLEKVLQCADLTTKQAFISGGEVTVTMGDNHNDPDGGPSREFALALASALRGHPQVHALIADTDGVDGKSSDDRFVAGAVIDPTTLQRAHASKLNTETLLNQHQSGLFFRTLGDEVITGPTNTNVNDFRVILIN